jgi:hypothetical protein
MLPKLEAPEAATTEANALLLEKDWPRRDQLDPDSNEDHDCKPDRQGENDCDDIQSPLPAGESPYLLMGNSSEKLLSV